MKIRVIVFAVLMFAVCAATFLLPDTYVSQTGVAPLTVIADGSDPMPLCRKKVCPPRPQDGGPIPLCPPKKGWNCEPVVAPIAE
jgi:hypothetical protein